MSSYPAGVSFLICTHNGSSLLAETLGCLARQTVLQEIDWEVILVDNASTDSTVELAATCWEQLGAPVPLRIFQEPTPGKNFAVKTGFEQVRYRYACIVDDDNRLATDYLEIGFRILERDPQIGILGGQNTGEFEVAPPAWFPDFQAYYAVGVPRNYAPGAVPVLTAETDVTGSVLWGAGLFVRRELWAQMQELGFKSLFSGRVGTKNLTAGEDDELCYVAAMLGYKVWYSPALQLRHFMVASRLNTAYRNRLFYSVAYGYTRLSAYRHALSDAPLVSLSTDMLKDATYLGLGMVRNLFSAETFRAFFSNALTHRMNLRLQLLILRVFIGYFPTVRKYYIFAAHFKEQKKHKADSRYD